MHKTITKRRITNYFTLFLCVFLWGIYKITCLHNYMYIPCTLLPVPGIASVCKINVKFHVLQIDINCLLNILYSPS